MIDVDQSFWHRIPSSSEYCNEKQGPHDHCVYSSIVGAINHLSAQTLWRSGDLLAACHVEADFVPTFDSVMPVAIKRATMIEYRIQRDREEKNPDCFLGKAMNCVMKGGVAVISLETSSTPPPAINWTQAITC